MKIVTIIFTYNRPEHTKKVLEGLKNNTILPEKLIIFHDGYKRKSEITKWNEVENIIRNIDWCPCEVNTNKENKGLAESVMNGVTQALADNDAVIVLEDDCVPAPSFLRFMMQALEKYQYNEKVQSISGYAWPIDIEKDEYDAYFTGRVSSWGWATWKDRWTNFSRDDGILNKIINNKETSARLAMWGRDLAVMFKAQQETKIDSWAVYWALNCIELGKYNLAPFKSLISNIGCDGSGVHCGPSTFLSRDIDLSERFIFNLPEVPENYEKERIAFTKLYGSRAIEQNNGEDAVIYGLGNYFHEHENDVCSKFNVIAFTDKNKIGYYAGKKILKPEELAEHTNIKIIIMIFNDDIINEVKNKLISEYKIDKSRIVAYKYLNN